MDIALRHEVFVTKSVVQGKPLGELPSILEISRNGPGAYSIGGLGILSVIVPETTHEIGQWISRESGSVTIEIKVAVIEEIVKIILFDPCDIGAKLHFVLDVYKRQGYKIPGGAPGYLADCCPGKNPRISLWISLCGMKYS